MYYSLILIYSTCLILFIGSTKTLQDFRCKRAGELNRLIISSSNKYSEYTQHQKRQLSAEKENLCEAKQIALKACFNANGSFLEDICSEENAVKWIDEYENDLMWKNYQESLVYWDYVTNVTNETESNV